MAKNLGHVLAPSLSFILGLKIIPVLQKEMLEKELEIGEQTR